MIYAHIQSGIVTELFTPPVGTTIAECFHADLVTQFVDVTAAPPQPGWTATETNGAWSFAAPVAPPIDARPAARAALTASDITILRCYEHAVAVPADWTAYRAALRVLVSGPATTGPLPPMPAYPVGT
jgi:hypothetical protein